MANVNVAFGLKPINTAGSTPATSGTNAYFIDSGASAIFQGSIVKCDNGGEIVISSATGDTLKFLLAFLLAVNMYPQLQVKKFSQIHGPVQVRTQTSTLSDLCTITRCSVTLLRRMLHLPTEPLP